ncbi:MAG TPA: O-antigen ligase family protein [Thiohalobacter sp.]|nr:O-antigen ligase family protein [Thiohalobacter sp.]
MAAFFVWPNPGDMKKIFLVAVFVPVLMFSCRSCGRLIESPALLAAAVLVVWANISAFWSAGFDWRLYGDLASYSVFLLTFLALSSRLAEEETAGIHSLAGALTVVAAVSATVSIIYWYQTHEFPWSRLVGFGPQVNPNTSVVIYAWMALAGVMLAIRETRLFVRVLLASCTIMLLVAVLLTQSNTGILACAVALMLLLFLLVKEGGAGRYVLALIVLGVAAGIYALHSFGLTGDGVDSGLVSRQLRWFAIMEYVSQAPILGNGYLKDALIAYGPQGGMENHAHNAFLGIARDGGLIGLLLFLVMFGVWLRQGMALFREKGYVAPLVFWLHAFVYMLAEIDQVIGKPSYIWVFFWLPLAYTAGMYSHILNERRA